LGQTVAEAADDALGEEALGDDAVGDGLLAVLPPPDEQPETSSTALSSAAATGPALMSARLPCPPGPGLTRSGLLQAFIH
jgi:hypothetical protein